MSPEELLELSQKLSQEKLYIQTERDHIFRLNNDVAAAAAQVCKTAWLVKQQRTNLSRLTQDDASLCCLKANVLETTNFIDAFHHLNYHESKFSTFLKVLKDDPGLVAEFIVRYSTSANIYDIIDILMGAVYGSCVSPHEEVLVATMLRDLAVLLMSNPDNSAHRVLTKDKCSWCHIYRAYTDSLPSCKLFLAAALHQPIINLLTRDEWFYDIELSKVVERFPPMQRLAKFGPPGTEAYNTKLKEYRMTIVKHLHRFAMDFVDHIKEAVMCFPAPLRWLISHFNRILLSTGRYSEMQSRYLCTELVFDLYICPAVIDPMLYGLTSDVTVSHIARHNLMQVARILQILSKGQRSDERSRVADLYSLFEEDCLVGVMNTIVQNEPSQTLRLHSTNMFTRSSIFIGTQQLDTLVQAFRETVNSQPEESILRLRGGPVVKNLPNLSLSVAAEKEPTVSTPSQSPQTKSKRKHVKKLAQSDSMGSLGSIPTFTPQDVITITIEDTEQVGLIEEEKVLSSVDDTRESSARMDGAMKKTRFYLAQDQESIGNVSEYQASELADAISEAASVRSERSTNLDDGEDVDDNLSDMVSANVSGRGSPNISGRETPQSVDDGAVGGDPNPPNLPVTVPKPNNDLTDRFGKFGIETRVDRAIDNRSLVSDSWSTDVYGSDTEPTETPYEGGEPPLIPEMISETASESAWSTDVLNSDTSERPCDRLKELDQIDESLASIDQGSESDAMSTRSTDSRRGEPNSPFVPVRQTVPAAVPQAMQQGHAFNFVPSSTINQPAFVSNGSGSDSRRPDIVQLNHSTGSSFMTTLNQLPDGQMFHNSNSYQQTGHPTSQLSNQLSAMGTLQPLQPIRTQVGQSGNLLDMFDPLSDELLTPPISQGQVLDHGSSLGGQPGTNVMNSSTLPRSAWPPINDQSGDQSHASNAVSAWTRASSNMAVGDDISGDRGSEASWHSQDPWGAAPPPSVWPSNDSGIFTSSNQNLGGTEVAARDIWSSIAPVEPRPKTWNNVAGGSMRHTVTPANRFAVIEDESLDISRRPASWVNQSTANCSLAVSNVTTSAQAGSSLLALAAAGGVLSLTPGQGAIPKRTLPRTNSQSSANDDPDSTLIVPGKKLGKEKKGMLNSLIKKGKRGRSSGKGSPMRPLERQADRASPAISEPRDEVASSASDDSGRLKEPRRDSERSEKAESINEDILEKYRTATSNGGKPPGSLNLPTAVSPGLSAADEVDEASTPIYDPNNLEKCLAFADAKKKLRLVLSTPALYSISLLSMYRHMHDSSDATSGSSENFLAQYLQVLHAEALLHQNLQLITQIQETTRCIQRFSNTGCRKLVRALRDEYQSRVHYISYLAKSRQRLLGMQSRIQGMLQTLNRDKESCFVALIQECVRVFLDKKEAKLRRMQSDFSKLQSPDEKADELENCLMFLCDEIDRDEIWNGANSTMREAAQLAIERAVMEKVYKFAMFPNGDGDTQRDKIYSESVARLAVSITPNHRKLRISAAYHLEAPWSSAQAHLVKINAFKTPRDKVQCVSQCVKTIMGLLRLAHTKSVPGADDFLPVFIYVLIMANPPFLLSTIQYVDSLYGSRMEGEECYNWTQLNTAVAFIKMWLQEFITGADS